MRPSTVALATLVSRASPITPSSSNAVKLRPTLGTPRWRMDNPIDEELVSTVQRPAASGGEIVGAVGMTR